MEKFLADIDNILLDCDSKINDKITGINFLEELKYFLIDKIRTFKNTDLEIIKNTEIIKKLKDRNLLIKIENHNESKSKIKYTLTKDTLFIVLKGLNSFKIFNNKDDQRGTSFNIFPITGISINNNTVINESSLKNTTILSILLDNESIDIEK